MTPAEKLAKQKSKEVAKSHPNRKIVWRCLLKQKRESLGLTMRDIGGAIGRTSSCICTVERGEDVTLSTAMLLAEFFGCEIKDLWPERIKEQ